MSRIRRRPLGVQFSRAIFGSFIGLALFGLTARARAADEIAFERDIVGILVRHCLGCHNSSDPAGGLDLSRSTSAFAAGDSQQPAIVPHQPDKSHVLERIRNDEMPPDGKGKRLSSTDAALLEAWIKAGAPWPADRVLRVSEFTTDTRAGRDWWSLKKPKRPIVPTVRHVNRVGNPIDAFVLVRLEEQGWELADETDRATFIRRASFDLHGLPPSPVEIEQFVHDARADAFETLIDRLLASPRYGERWGRHWLDVVRFGESNGYETNTARPNAWPYRDWVIRAINEDLPYPQFVFAQLAGDQSGEDAATGYLVGGAHDVVGSPDVELTLQQRLNDVDDMVSTTATAFLGLTVGCAKCHDHKFDPISQRDYYSLQAVFAGVQHGEREPRTIESEKRRQQETVVRSELVLVEAKARELLARHEPLAQAGGSAIARQRPSVNARANVDRFEPVRARIVRFTVQATNQAEPCIDELEVFTAEEQPRNIALASSGSKATASGVFADGGSSLHKLEHIHDGRYGNARSWISSESGAGWVQIELAEPAIIDRVVWARDRKGNFKDRLPTRYKIETSMTGDDWQRVASSDDRKAFDPAAKLPEMFASDGLPPEAAAQIAQFRSETESLRIRLAELAPQKIYAGTFSQPEATHVLYRGEPLQKRETVAPGAIAAVGLPLSLSVEANEADRRMTLARWIGDENNPLTARVIVNRIWHYHFGQGLVKTPSDFGFQAGHPSHPELLDWLATEFMTQGWRPKALHRLIMLSSAYRQASRLNPRAAAGDAGGRLLWRFSPRRLEAEPIRDTVLWTSGALDLRMGGPGYEVFEPNTNYVKVYTPKQSFTAAEWRRMVYQDKPRMRQDATFGEFDCPDSSQTMARRNVSTTALQALNLLNGSFMMQQAELFAERLRRETGEDADHQIREAFWLAFGRAPASEELVAARRLVAEQGLLVFCRALYNANEFLYLN